MLRCGEASIFTFHSKDRLVYQFFELLAKQKIHRLNGYDKHGIYCIANELTLV